MPKRVPGASVSTRLALALLPLPIVGPCKSLHLRSLFSPSVQGENPRGYFRAQGQDFCPTRTSLSPCLPVPCLPLRCLCPILARTQEESSPSTNSLASESQIFIFRTEIIVPCLRTSMEIKGVLTSPEHRALSIPVLIWFEPGITLLASPLLGVIPA